MSEVYRSTPYTEMRDVVPKRYDTSSSCFRINSIVSSPQIEPENSPPDENIDIPNLWMRNEDVAPETFGDIVGSFENQFGTIPMGDAVERGEVIVQPLEGVLSERQLTIFRLKSEGLSPSQIANRLDLAVQTVKNTLVKIREIIEVAPYRKFRLGS